MAHSSVLLIPHLGLGFRSLFVDLGVSSYDGLVVKYSLFDSLFGLDPSSDLGSPIGFHLSGSSSWFRILADFSIGN